MKVDNLLQLTFPVDFPVDLVHFPNHNRASERHETCDGQEVLSLLQRKTTKNCICKISMWYLPTESTYNTTEPMYMLLVDVEAIRLIYTL